MGGPGFYGPMGEVEADPPHVTGSMSTTDPISGSVTGDEEDSKKEVKGENDKKEKQGTSREAFMDPTFGGFYDDLAAGPPVDKLPPGERPYEKGKIGRISDLCALRTPLTDLSQVELKLSTINVVEILDFVYSSFRTWYDGCRIPVTDDTKL